MRYDLPSQLFLDKPHTYLVLSGQPEPDHCDRYIHLSFKNLRDHHLTSHDASVSRQFIDLGATPVDWHNTINTRAQGIYLLALERAQHTLSKESQLRTARETEILVGKLCSLLAWRIARAESQLGELDVAAVALAGSQEVKLPAEPPSSSAEALKVIASEEFGGLVEAYCAANTMFVRAKVKVISDAGAHHEWGAERIPLINKAYGFVSWTLRKLTRRSRVAVFTSYLGRFREALLQLSLFQMPLLTESRTIFEPRTNCPSTRGLTSLQRALDSVENLPLEVFLQACLDYLTPLSVMECFEASRRMASTLGWPVSPEVVFTSNNFDTDDVFKAYLVSLLPRIKYVVGQHGGAYGTARMFLPCPELSTADLFLSWGWKGENVVSVGRIKPRVKVARGPYSGVVLILRDRWEFFTASDPEYAMSIYLASLGNLITSLKQQDIRVAVRTHHVSCPQTEQFLLDIGESNDDIEIDRMTKSPKHWAKLNYGYVFCYDSTGMLEIGSSGGEFFAFLPEGSRGVLPEFEQNYSALRLSGLMSGDPEEAANMIGKWCVAKDRLPYQVAISYFLDGIVATDKNSFLRVRRVISSLLSKGVLWASR